MDNGQARSLLKAGDRFGDYIVERLLGKGGMGAVFLVRTESGSRYAVKVMYPDMMSHDMRVRFAREAKFAMDVRHRNLISVYDVGEDPDTGLCYIIMDYVPGGSLSDKLKAAGRLPVQEAVSIVTQVASGLDAAHRRGLVHRDVKPDNILFDADGTPKLADLGVAKLEGDSSTMVTMSGEMIGTPAYMSPEQLMDSHSIDARSDIYALGVVLYEMLTGRRPNEGSSTVELLAKALKGEPLPDIRTMRPEVSASIAYALSRMCDAKPDNRPPTALAAAQLLQKAARGRIVLAKKPPRSADAAAARQRKSRMPFLSIAAVTGAIAICAAVAAKFMSKPPQKPLSFQSQPAMQTNVIERTVVVTNFVEREPVPPIPNTSMDDVPAMPPSPDIAPPAAPYPNAAKTDNGAESITPYLSKTSLHAAYRSQDRVHAFVEVCHSHDDMNFETPPFTLARVNEAISLHADILHFPLACTKDGVLFSAIPENIERISNGNGSVGDYSAAQFKRITVKNRGDDTPEGFASFEDMLDVGRGRILFKVSGAQNYARELEELLDRLDAWESVIVEMVDVANSRRSYGARFWRKVLSGEAQIMVFDDSFDEWRGIVHECSVWGWNLDLARHGIEGVAQRIDVAFVYGAGESGRTDDEAGWEKALSEGATILRTNRPGELYLYLGKRGVAWQNAQGQMARGNSSHPAGESRNQISESDGKQMSALIDGRIWYYSLENNEAVIHRGDGGYSSMSMPAVSPKPKGKVVVPSEIDGHRVTVIGSHAFFECDDITEVVIPEGVREIHGWGTFYRCTHLKRLKMPSTLRRFVGMSVVLSCPDLEEIDLANCEQFEGRAANGCPKCKFSVSDDNPSYVVVDGAVYSKDMEKLIRWPESRQGDIIIPPGVSEIGPWACHRSKASAVVLHGGIVKIGGNAFSEMNNVKHIKIPDGVELIGSSCFSKCKNIQTVTLPATLERIEGQVFSKCQNLKYVIFCGSATFAYESQLLGRTPESMEVLVPRGTEGWNNANVWNTQSLPDKWPVNGGADARRIRYVEDVVDNAEQTVE